MLLVIYVNETFEEEKALVDVSDGHEVLLKGDGYHDKIDHKIEGYMQALKDQGLYDDDPDREEIGPDHFMFSELEFYDDSYEYDNLDEEDEE